MMQQYQTPIQEYINFDILVDDSLVIFEYDKAGMGANWPAVIAEIDELSSGAHIHQRPVTKITSQFNYASERSTYDVRLELGQRLFGAVFDARGLRLFRKAQDIANEKKHGLRIRIVSRNDEVQDLPWELLHNGQQFLCLTSTTPIVRKMAQSNPQTDGGVIESLDVLVIDQQPDVINDPDDAKLIELLRSHLQVRSVDIGRWVGERQQKQYEILHFLANERYSGESLSAGLMEKSILIFAQAKGTPLWVRSPNCATVLFPTIIHQDGYAAFAYEFYRELLEYQPIEVAMTSARQHLNVSEPGSYTWAQPRLFLHSDHGFKLARLEPVLSEGMMDNLQFGAIKGIDLSLESATTPEQQRQLQRLQMRLDLFQRNYDELQKQRARFGSEVEIPPQLAAQISELEEQIAQISSAIDESVP